MMENGIPLSEIEDKIPPEHLNVLKELDKMYRYPLEMKNRGRISSVTSGFSLEDGKITGIAIGNVDYLPEELFKIQSLKKLIFSLKLDHFPEEIFSLPNLEVLEPNGYFEAIPPEIGELTGLKRLTFSYNNKLTAFPEEIGNLTKLQRLKVWHNELESLPESIGNLDSLQILNLEENNLSRLPDSFCKLTNLRELYLKRNQLKTLPKDFGNLTSLKKLDISSNKLTSLPESFTELSQLTDCKLSYNRLSRLPEKMGKLTRLRRLNLGSNPLRSLPPSLGTIEFLTELSIYRTKVRVIPRTFSELVEQDLYRLEKVEWIEAPISSPDVLEDLREAGVTLRPRLLGPDSQPHPSVKMSKAQIKEFLIRLSRYGKCGGKDYIFAKKALNAMGIPKKVQNNLLALCKEFGGYCDCEILMNAGEQLVRDGLISQTRGKKGTKKKKPTYHQMDKWL